MDGCQYIFTRISTVVLNDLHVDGNLRETLALTLEFYSLTVLLGYYNQFERNFKYHIMLLKIVNFKGLCNKK